ncbi:MAG: tetracycline resistance MFS efflux pump [Patescibacteria group bacterium]|nr:MAG: tetracycline resistance MFS efflux pump [Patescibacteria group bacterium]
MKNKKALITIFLIVFIDLLGFGIILPLLPFIAEKYEANPAQIGFLTATYSFFQLIASPILGRLSDRYGRKKILILSQLGSAIGYLILALANSLPLLFISRIIDGITGGNISIAQAYIADVTDNKNRARGMGLIGAAFGLGFIFGPAIGGALSKISYSAPALLAAFVSLLTIMTTFLFLDETVNTEKSTHSKRTEFSLEELKKVLQIPNFVFLILIFFLINLSFSLTQGNLALWTEKTFGYDASKNGAIFAYVGVLAVLVQLVILPFLLKRINERNILKIATFNLFLSFLLIYMAKNEIIFYLALTFMPLGNGLANPSLQAIASENVKKEEYGGTLGFLQSAGSLGRILGPIIGGEIFYIFGKNIPFALASAILFLVFMITIKIKLNKTN